MVFLSYWLTDPKNNRVISFGEESPCGVKVKPARTHRKALQSSEYKFPGWKNYEPQ